jgi:hypothetical protein
MRPSVRPLVFIVVLSTAAVAAGQEAVQQTASSRTALIEQAEAAKAEHLKPAQRGKAEEYVSRISDALLGGQMHWHTFWESAYSGGGFTLGAGYTHFVSSYNTVDVRGSITFSGYKRIESELLAPELFARRGRLSVLGGWREATEVGFYGFGMTSTKENRANYSFQQPYVNGTLEVFPTKKLFMMRGGVELTQWKQRPGSGSAPSVDTVYTSSTLPGLGASPVYVHAQGTVGLDSRPAKGYAKRGGFYGATLHDFTDADAQYGFRQVDYEAIQHIPILRDAWVVSLHARAEMAYDKSDQTIPFFMMPSIGGGSNLRAYSSWRLRDLNSLLLQAEWRAIANRFFDVALFYDAGKVAARRSDLDLHGMKSDVGLGFRWHGPATTPLRIELTKGNEGFALVFAASEVF